jgi:hypothetical protein
MKQHTHDFRRVSELHVEIDGNIFGEIFDIAKLVECFPENLKVLKIDAPSSRAEMFNPPILKVVERCKSLETLELFVPVATLSDGPLWATIAETLTKLKKLTIPKVFDIRSDMEMKYNSLRRFSKLEELTMAVTPKDIDAMGWIADEWTVWMGHSRKFPPTLQRCIDEMFGFFFREQL